jgi:hypothetical protein
MVTIGEAGNTWYPSLYIIVSKGYELELEVIKLVDRDDRHPSVYIAKKNDARFKADNFLSLLGMISIRENLGDNFYSKVVQGEQLAAKVIKHRVIKSRVIGEDEEDEDDE